MRLSNICFKFRAFGNWNNTTHPFRFVGVWTLGCLPLLFLGAMLSFCGSGYAQTKVQPPPGVARVWGSVADNDRPTALHLNPAGLAFQPAWGLHYLHTDIGNPLEIGRGEGDALFVSFKPFSFWGLGTGIQVLYPEPTLDKNAPSLGTHVRFTLGSAFRVGTWLSLGLNFHALFGEGRDIQSLVLFDLGLILRPWSFLSLGVMARNLNAPAWGDAPGIIPRTWDLGISLRPLGHDRWVISADFRLPEPGQMFQFSYRMEGEPVPGWILGVRVSHDLPLQNVGVEAFLGFRFGSFGFDAIGAADIPTSTNPARWGGWTASLWYSARPYRSLVIPPGRMPLLDIAGSLPERTHNFPFGKPSPLFFQLLLAIEKARQDPSVRGLLLRIGPLRAGLAKIQELREALLRFKKSGKTIVVYLNSAQTKAYYLASLAHKIVLNPAGSIWLQGLSSQHFFFAPLLQKLGIRPLFVKYGKYKTGPNQFTESTMTPAHQEASRQLLDDFFAQLTQGLAESRKVSEQQVQQWLKHGLFTAEQARQSGLIDGIFHWDELWPHLSQSYQNQLWLDPGYFQRQQAPTRWKPLHDAIAIIHVDGAIVSGTNLDDPLFGVHLSGASTIIRSLIQARYNTNIRAVVLRIDSPGGEVMASDLIWRYVDLLRQVKPVIVSMGSVAASGGYYIAAPAHRILASKATVTGSIGIYAGKFDFSGLLHKIGVKVQTQGRGPMADLFSAFSSWTPQQHKQFQAHIHAGYLDFLQKVATGRRQKLATIRQVAAGRVWSGIRAKSLGLIDQWGGLWDALQVARTLAGISAQAPVRYVSWPDQSFWRLSPRSALGLSATHTTSQRDPLQQLFSSLRLKTSTPMTWIPQLATYWSHLLERLQTPQLWALASPWIQYP